MLKGYRGFLRELGRTGSWRAFRLQLWTGAAHVARGALRRRAGDPVQRFLENYAADGFRLPDRDAAALQATAEACLVCGLCSAECARVGGRPAVDPRDAVIAASRLAIDWVRLGIPPAASPSDGCPPGAACAGCRACDAICPVGIPIGRVQQWLAAGPRIL